MNFNRLIAIQNYIITYGEYKKNKLEPPILARSKIEKSSYAPRMQGNACYTG